MCGATVGGLSLEGINPTKEAVIQGQVLRGGVPVESAYVRLLDRSGEFTAEVPTSAKAEPVDTAVVAAVGSVAEVQIAV